MSLTGLTVVETPSDASRGIRRLWLDPLFLFHSLALQYRVLFFSPHVRNQARPSLSGSVAQALETFALVDIDAKCRLPPSVRFVAQLENSNPRCGTPFEESASPVGLQRRKQHKGGKGEALRTTGREKKDYQCLYVDFLDYEHAHHFPKHVTATAKSYDIIILSVLAPQTRLLHLPPQLEMVPLIVGPSEGEESLLSRFPS